MQWEDEGYIRKDDNGQVISMEEYERTQAAKGVFTKNDLKLYAICGIGFMLDAYDLFIINLVNPVWTYEYWGGLAGPGHKASPVYPFLLKGAVNAAANIGNVIGQVGFGFMGDTFGRKFVYGKELIIAIVGLILIISMPNAGLTSTHKMWYLFGMRILLGIGIGGDYPMSASIVAERSTLKNRGRMLALIFSNQGWGTLAASIVSLCAFGAFSGELKAGNYGKLDGVWRTQIGVAILPAAVTLYFRLKMPESKKFTQSQELSAVKASSLMSSSSTLNTMVDVNEKDLHVKSMAAESDSDRRMSVIEAHAVAPTQAVSNRAAIQYFSEWRHLKVLIGTALSWFLVDVAFYGTNLNQSVLLTAIGFAKGKTEYDTLIKTGYGNLIIAAAGYVPGYFLTVAFIEILGRRWIQIQGFLVTALMFGILAGDYLHLGTGGKFACFTIAQLFFNFGANATTFIVPAEVFPSRVRGFGHGVSAAVGKLGAILAGVLFNYLAQYKIGVPNTLWIFFACNILGAVVTFLLVPETKGLDADAVDYAEIQEAVAQKAARHQAANVTDGAAPHYVS